MQFSDIVSHDSFLTDDFRKNMSDIFSPFFSQFPVFPSYFMQSLHSAALNRKLYYVKLFWWQRADKYSSMTLFFIGLFSELSFKSF